MKKIKPIPHKSLQNQESPTFSSWLRVTLYAVLLGIGIGLVLSILISVIDGKWIGTRRAVFQFVFSCAIGFFVSNSIHFSKRLWAGKGTHIFYVTLYYLFSLAGVFVAIELIYYIFAYLFNTPYTFFHKSDFLFSSVITLIVSTVSYIYFSQKNRFSARLREQEIDLLRAKQMKTQAELATLQSKINPHFLYNSLNAIASLIHLDPDKAESMTLKLSKLFRYSINQNQDNLISVEEEMEILQTYLDIEKVRFGERINFIVEVDEHIIEKKIPRFLIQPLVENALKHGLKNTLSSGELKVSIREHDGIEIIVSDNGLPFPDELEIGYGLQSTYDKLELLYNDRYEVQLLNNPFKQIKLQLPFV